jgi:hypothetical protein
MPETKILQSPDYVILLSFFAILIFIGVYFRRYIQEAKDYFAAGAALGIFLWFQSHAQKALVVNLVAGVLMFLSGFLLRVLIKEKNTPANS